MRKITYFKTISLFSLLFVLALAYNQSAVNSIDQVDQEAKILLDKTTAKLDAQNAIKVEFDLEMLVPGQDSDLQKGLLIQDGDQFLFDIESQMIVSNAEAVYVYLKNDNEIQINDPDYGEDGSLLSPAQMMRLYETESFFYAITDVVGDLTKIEFKPEDEYSDYSKLRLSIDHKVNEIRKMEIFSKDGSRIYFDVNSLIMNPDLEQNTFEFDITQYPKAYIEDLRID